ncbi:MAG: SDR family NAD(P)-dependent oxidoreductase [Rubrivivax sp.]|nr:SDR family NAD(P)-dependent oxidoreductase [Rubrivivax sp.]
MNALPAATLQGRRIAVTGGLGRLGQALGALLLARGARVVLMDRHAAEAGSVAAAGAVVLGGVDLADEASATAGLLRAAAALGGLDGLVNVAGGFAWETLEGGQAATWDRLYAMNLRSAVLASQAALPLLLAQPRSAIVNVGAAAALKAGLGMGAYAASKAGVARLTEALAEEFKARGLRVNAVLPSVLDTPANRAEMPDADPTRWVGTDELARVIAFLLSDEASAVTGASLPVMGRV